MKMIQYRNPILNEFYNIDRWFDEALRGFGLTRGASDVAGAGRVDYRPWTETYEDESNYNVRFELPGVRKEDVTVELNDSVITVKGERTEEKEGAENVTPFSRSVLVPREINAEKAKAKLKDGLLVVSFPKEEASKKRLILVT